MRRKAQTRNLEVMDSGFALSRAPE